MVVPRTERSGRAGFAAFAAFAVTFTGLVISTGCSPASRDVVPGGRDVRVAPSADGSAPAASNEAYVYVARRPHAAIGLVGAHFMSDADAHRLVDRLADDLEGCAGRLEERGALVEGAMQLVAASGARGNAEVTDMRLAPGGPVASNALECVVAPLRVLAFPAPPKANANAGTPALAIEITWNPAPRVKMKSDAGSGTDAGAPAP